MDPSSSRRPAYRAQSSSYRLSGAAQPRRQSIPITDKSALNKLQIPSSRSTPASSSSSSTPIPQPSRSKRHKPKYVHPPLTDNEKCVTLTTRMDIIVKRCYPQPPPSEPTLSNGKTPSPTGNGKKSSKGSAKGKGKANIPGWPEFHPYSRRYDLENDRSYNPSPKQIEKAAKEAEKAKLEMKAESSGKKDVAAPAVAMVKSRSKSSSSKEKPIVVKRTSPRNTHQPLLPSPELPSSVASSPITSSFVIPKPPMLNNTTRPLKRTRSVGLGISIGTANSIGLNEPSVASPLRRVTGPADQEGDSNSPGRKRVREDDNAPSAKRAKTTSPTSVMIRLNPTISASPQQTHEEDVKEDGKATQKSLGLPTLDGGSTQMRRVASASAAVMDGSRSKARRQSSSDSVVSNTRVRREVAIPERFRDFELGGVAA